MVKAAFPTFSSSEGTPTRTVWLPPTEQNPYQRTEALWDEVTRAVIGEIGVRTGWRCLEVGAGSGSIAKWLGRIVAPDGCVVATDLHIDALASAAGPNVEVRQHDICSGPVSGDFDLAYARLVMAYVERAALSNLVSEVRRGGTVLLQDYDWSSFSVEPRAPATQELVAHVADLITSLGIDSRFGEQLPRLLGGLGVIDVEVTRRTRTFTGATEGTSLLARVITTPYPTLLSTGRATPELLQAALAELQDTRRQFRSPALVSVCGIKS